MARLNRSRRAGLKLPSSGLDEALGLEWLTWRHCFVLSLGWLAVFLALRLSGSRPAAYVGELELHLAEAVCLAFVCNLDGKKIGGGSISSLSESARARRQLPTRAPGARI